MNIFKRLFRSKEVEKLQLQVNDLTKRLEASALSDSLLGFVDGQVYYYNLSTNNTFSDHYTIYRGIDLLASLGSGLPVNIYRGDNIVPPESYLPGGFNIYEPNLNMSLNELHYAALVYFFYRGEYMVEIKEDPFFHLMPINPEKMTRHNNKIDWKFDNGYERRIINDDNLIYVKALNPDDDKRGLSPVDVVKADLMNEKSAIDYNTAWFKNFGKIGGFFYDSEAKARPDDMQKVVTQFDATKTGANKAGVTLGLPGGIRYEEFNKTMAEMQYLQSRKDIRDRILAILGIHKALFGVTDQVNRSVSEEATRMLWLHNLKPKMLRIQEAWQRTLFKKRFPIFTYKYDFTEVSELKQSIETTERKAKLLKDLGYTTNEINEFLKLGMEYIDDPALNLRTIPNSVIPFSEYAENNNEEKASINHNKLLAEYFEPEEVKQIEASSNRVKYQRYSRKIRKIMQTSEKRMASKLGRFFSKELGDVIKVILGQQQAAKDIEPTVTLAKILNILNENKTELITMMKPLYKQASIEADQLAIDTIAMDTEAIANSEIVHAMTNKITNISNHTYRLIRTQLKAGIDSGETIDQIANRVKNVYKFNSARARLIARTETLGIVNKTTNARYKMAGVKYKAWLHTGGANGRVEHAQNAAQGEIPFDEQFQNGQSYPGEGTASQVINCRCCIIPVIK